MQHVQHRGSFGDAQGARMRPVHRRRRAGDTQLAALACRALVPRAWRWQGGRQGAATPRLPVEAGTGHADRLAGLGYADDGHQFGHARHQERSSLGRLGSTIPSSNATFFWTSITASAATNRWLSRSFS